MSHGQLDHKDIIATMKLWLIDSRHRDSVQTPLMTLMKE